MKYHVKFNCLGMKSEGNPDVIREMVGKQIEHIEKSGMMVDGGTLLGSKGGYFIFDVPKSAEILGLLGRTFLENFDIEVHPVISFKEMGEYMMEEYKKAA
jgi:hypothetical protein